MGGGAKLRKKVEGKGEREKAKKFPLNGKYLRAGEKGERKGTSLLVILSREYKRRAVQTQRRRKRGKGPSSSFSPRRRLLKW